MDDAFDYEPKFDANVDAMLDQDMQRCSYVFPSKLESLDLSDLDTFTQILGWELTIPSFALGLMKCAAPKYKPERPLRSIGQRTYPWQSWSAKAWSYCHEIHGQNCMDDPRNVPYAMIFVSLILR